MAETELKTEESAEDRLKKRAEVANVEVFDGDSPVGEEEIVPGPNLEAQEEIETFEKVSESQEAMEGDETPELPEVIAPHQIINEYTEVYHYMRTVGMVSNPQSGIMAGAELDAEVNSILAGGYDIIDVLAAGYSPEGDRILFIFGKSVDGEKKHNEMHFVKRVLGIGEGAITGFNADVWVNYQIEIEGYKVYKTLLNGAPPEGIVLLWILVR
jgi:hypothetical protein